MLYIYSQQFTLYCFEFPVLSPLPVLLRLVMRLVYLPCRYQGETAKFGLESSIVCGAT